MTDNQKRQFNNMRATLIKISKGYMTPTQLEKACKSKNGYVGLGYQETLEMSYENIQSEAKAAVKGVKKL